MGTLGEIRQPAARPKLRVVHAPQDETVERARRVLVARHYAKRTSESYLHWIERFLVFHDGATAAVLREDEVNAFLTALAVDKDVAESTQNQARAALLFLYDKVLGQPLGHVDNVVRAKRPKQMPVVLSRSEVQALFRELKGVPLLVCQVLYGSGLRLDEALNLRVKDIDFHRREINIKRAKGNKDRTTMLPESAVKPLQTHLLRAKNVHRKDLAMGLGRVPLPFALNRKYRNAEREWDGSGSPLLLATLPTATTASPHLATLFRHPPAGGGL